MYENIEIFLLQFLNVFFFVFHFALIVFNLVGWAFRSTCKWHLASLSITAFSWFVLGIFYGWGYCFLTDWHYSIRSNLDLVVDASSYIHFLLKRLSMDFWTAQTTDILTGVLFGCAFLLSIYCNFSAAIKSKKPSR